VTIGIAALCERHRSIVLASDRMISYGDDFGTIGPTTRDVHAALQGESRPSVDDVSRAMVTAFRQQLRVKIDAFLSRFDQNLESFKQDALKVFGRTRRDRYWDEIERMKVDVEYLVAGFDPKGSPHLIEVQNPGVVIDCFPMAFTAIGSGGSRALSALSFHSFNATMSLERGIYHVCEAKFMAESAAGVGRSTSVVVMRMNDDRDEVDITELSDAFIADIRKEWDRDGKPKVPRRAGSLIEAGMQDSRKFRRVIFG
jgi:proteasome subunit B (beta)-like protein